MIIDKNESQQIQNPKNNNFSKVKANQKKLYIFSSALCMPSILISLLFLTLLTFIFGVVATSIYSISFRKNVDIENECCCFS